MKSINDIVKILGHVVCIVGHPDGSTTVTESKNIVMNAGDLYYAESPVRGTQPTNFTTATTPFPFDGVAKMYKSVSVAPTAGNKGFDLSGLTSKADPTNGSTTKAASSGYPKVNDTDGGNSGKGADILTYKFEYATGDWDDASPLDDIVITNPAVGASDALLMWADGLAVTKSNIDTLTVYINHTLTGS